MKIYVDEKIERAKEAVDRIKAKYDIAIDELEYLMAKRDELIKEEQITAIMKSRKSHDEILNFLKSDI